MTLGYYDETTRRAADESAANAGTLEQDEEFGYGDEGDEYRAVRWDEHDIVGFVCTLGIVCYLVAIALGA